MSTDTSRNKTRYILLTVLVVIIVILGASLYSCYQAVKAENHVRYVGMMNIASQKIAKTVRGLEMNALNEFDEVQKHLDSPEAVIAALKSKASLNPDVMGYFAAFEPNYFAKEGYWFEPYVHQSDSSGFVVSMVGSERHDYTKSGWYVRAKHTGESFWSDPYYYNDNDSLGISGNYCTYVRPIYDAKGRLACVCGADMTFEWLATELQSIDDALKEDDMLNKFRMFRNFDFYSVVINNNGTCIAHPQDKSVPITDVLVVHDLVDNKSGYVEMEVDGVPSVVYYAPIDYVDWSVAIVVTKQDIGKPIVIMGLILVLISIIGLIAVWLVCRRQS